MVVMCDCKKHHKKRAACTCICPEHRNFDAAYALAMSRWDSLREMGSRIEVLSGQLEAAKQATREIMRERNSWARELADMRDERDTARTDLDTFKSNQADALDWATARVANLEAAIQSVLDSVKPTGDPMETLARI